MEKDDSKESKGRVRPANKSKSVIVVIVLIFVVQYSCIYPAHAWVFPDGDLGFVSYLCMFLITINLNLKKPNTASLCITNNIVQLQ